MVPWLGLVVVVTNHVVTQIFQTAKPFVTNFARQNRIDRAFNYVCWRFIVSHGGDLIMRNDLLVMLSGLHMFGQQVQSSETLTTTHTFEDIPSLFVRSTNPNILTSNQFTRNGHLLPEDITLMSGRRG